MKNLKLLALAAVGCLTFVSCSDDDGDGDDKYSRIPGTYKMVAWNAPVEVDLDGNGTVAYDLTKESDCYGNSTLVVNEDGTYTLTSRYLDVDDTGEFNCRSGSESGTWLRDGDKVTTLSDTDITTNYQFTIQEERIILTRDLTYINYPIMSAEGDPALAMGDIRMVYKRQE